MPENSKVVVVGLGEVGKPLFELVSKHYDAVGVDISPLERIEQVDVLHVFLSVRDQGLCRRVRPVHRVFQAHADDR